MHKQILAHVISGTPRYFRFLVPGMASGEYSGCLGQVGFTAQADINGTLGGTLAIKAQSGQVRHNVAMTRSLARKAGDCVVY